MSDCYSKEYIKSRTNELYDSLPYDLESRKKCLDVRNEIIKLNYTFFGYVASSTFVENTTYEDKFQTALCSFLNMWWKYKWTPKYRADLSFAVFFKPRISEEIRRYLSSVSYTTRRSLCLKVAAQLNKPWSKITYDDLQNVKLPVPDMTALKSILGADYAADLSEFEMFLESPEPVSTIDMYQTTQYNSLEELLIQEMIEQESPISDEQLHHMASMFSVDYIKLKAALPKAMQQLYKRLKANLR